MRCVYIYTYYIHLYSYTYIQYIHTSIHPSIHTSIRAYVHTSIHPSIHPCMHACTHASIYPSIHGIHTSIHTYIHTHIHMGRFIGQVGRLYIYIVHSAQLSGAQSVPHCAQFAATSTGRKRFGLLPFLCRRFWGCRTGDRSAFECEQLVFVLGGHPKKLKGEQNHHSPLLCFAFWLQDLRMVHSAATVQGPVEKWVVPIWSLQAGPHISSFK